MNLFVIPSWYPTKIHPESGTFFREQAQILSRNGINITVISPIQHSLWNLFQFKSDGIRWEKDGNMSLVQKETINKFPKCESLSFKAYQKATISLFQQAIEKIGEPDAVYIHSSLWAGAALFSLLDKMNIPFAVSEHLMGFMYKNGLSNFQKKKIAQTYEKALSVVATSSALKDNILRQFPNVHSKLKVIPNPADIQSFELKILSDQPNPFHFIYIGLFRPEKRLVLLLNAFSLVNNKHPNSHLVIVGDGPLRNKVHQQIRKLNLSSSVTLKGYLEKNLIARQLQKSDALVLSSDIETFGVAPIEAMACGLPVVATDCGGPSDYINSTTGVLVQKNNIQALAGGMISLIMNYKNYSGKDIRRFVEKNYGDQIYTDHVQSIFTDLI